MSDYDLASYAYDLPPGLIAAYPPEKRGDSRLMVLSRTGDAAPVDSMFGELPRFLPRGALLVANNSRVLPARLYGTRATGGKVELLLLSPLPLLLRNCPEGEAPAAGLRVECLLRAGGRIREGEILDFGANLQVEVLEKGAYGRHVAILRWRGRLGDIFAAGEIPLPPYLGRKAEALDTDRYQTIYADKRQSGSVAAPTAGLHFTEKMKAALIDMGFGWTELTLHVGYGTFSPVRSEDIRQHAMHAEYVEISPACAAMVNQARAEGRPVVAVGTTSIRALEGAVGETGTLAAFSDWLNIFIYPGKKFRIASGLLTNFHLPGSTLLMLASAFAGREYLLAAYRHAVEERYRFFSYGDAMLIV